MTNMKQKIEKNLQNAFFPNHLRVVNESGKHQGHAGDDGSGESHFRIDISSKMFANISRVECHRMIYKALANEIDRIHALSINIK